MGGGVLCRAGPGDPRLVMAFVPLGCLWGAWALPVLGTGPKLPKPDTGGLRPGWVVVGRTWGGDKPSGLQPLSASAAVAFGICCPPLTFAEVLTHTPKYPGSVMGVEGPVRVDRQPQQQRAAPGPADPGCLRGSCGWRLSGAVAVISQACASRSVSWDLTLTAPTAMEAGRQGHGPSPCFFLSCPLSSEPPGCL